MKVHVEWGVVAAGTRFKVCAITGQMVLGSAKQGRELATQLLHTATNGGCDKPDVDFTVSARNPRVIAWTNNGLNWVAVSAIGAFPSPVGGNMHRSPTSTCSPEAEALGFATDAEMEEHQCWLKTKATPEYIHWLQCVAWAKNAEKGPELLLSLGVKQDFVLSAAGHSFLGVCHGELFSASHSEVHVFAPSGQKNEAPKALLFAKSAKEGYQNELSGHRYIGFVKDCNSNQTAYFFENGSSSASNQENVAPVSASAKNLVEILDFVSNQPELAELIREHSLDIDEDAFGDVKFCLSVDGMSITDLELSSCGRFKVEPSEYGFSLAQSTWFKTLGELLDEATNLSLDTFCKKVQDSMGIEAGDYAGIHFSSSDEVNPLRKVIGNYMLSELKQRI